MAEHIDSTSINNNLRYRFEYLSKFLNFTNDDIEMLNYFGQIALPFIPTVVDTLFQKLLEFDITKKYFLIRHFSYTGTLPINETELTFQSEQMAFRRSTLIKYLKRIFRQRVWNDAFLEYLSYVGKMHTNMAGSESIDVNYIHISAFLAYMENILLDTVLTNDQIDNTRKKLIILALNKFSWIQNDLFAMHYIIQSKNNNLQYYLPTTVVKTSNCLCN